MKVEKKRKDGKKILVSLRPKAYPKSERAKIAYSSFQLIGVATRGVCKHGYVTDPFAFWYA